MQLNSSKYTPQQYRKYNGQSVIKALRAMGNEATAVELASYISEEINNSEDEILPEIKSVLRRAITNGFLTRNGQHYSLTGDEDSIQIDSFKRQRTSNYDLRADHSKRIRISFNKNNVDSNMSSSEDESEEEHQGERKSFTSVNDYQIDALQENRIGLELPHEHMSSSENELQEQRPHYRSEDDLYQIELFATTELDSSFESSGSQQIDSDSENESRPFITLRKSRVSK